MGKIDYMSFLYNLELVKVDIYGELLYKQIVENQKSHLYKESTNI